MFSFLRQLTIWHCTHLPDAHCCWLPINRYLLPAGTTAANLLQRSAATGCNRQTDRPMQDSFIDPDPHSQRAMSTKPAAINKHPVTLHTHTYVYLPTTAQLLNTRSTEVCCTSIRVGPISKQILWTVRTLVSEQLQTTLCHTRCIFSLHRHNCYTTTMAWRSG